METKETRARQNFTEIIESVLNKTEWYKHCADCGIVFEGNYERPLINLERLTGRKSLGREFNEYHVTGGYCPVHLEERMDRLNPCSEKFRSRITAHRKRLNQYPNQDKK